MALERHRACRWFDPGKYFYWSGAMLLNDEGEFLMGTESKLTEQLIVSS